MSSAEEAEERTQAESEVDEHKVEVSDTDEKKSEEGDASHEVVAEESKTAVLVVETESKETQEDEESKETQEEEEEGKETQEEGEGEAQEEKTTMPSSPVKQQRSRRRRSTDGSPNVSEKAVLERGLKGTVKWYNVKNAYGFINREDTNEDIFVHRTAISNTKTDFHSLADGESVQFDLVQGPKGLEAANVCGPDGGPVEGSKFAHAPYFSRPRQFYARRGGGFRRYSGSERSRGDDDMNGPAPLHQRRFPRTFHGPVNDFSGPVRGGGMRRGRYFREPPQYMPRSGYVPRGRGNYQRGFGGRSRGYLGSRGRGGRAPQDAGRRRREASAGDVGTEEETQESQKIETEKTDEVTEKTTDEQPIHKARARQRQRRNKPHKPERRSGAGRKRLPGSKSEDEPKEEVATVPEPVKEMCSKLVGGDTPFKNGAGDGPDKPEIIISGPVNELVAEE